MMADTSSLYRLELSEIWIYPVKSLGGVSLQRASVLPKGLAYDRRWMLIDAENRFMTQRTHPRMALFRVSQDAAGFLIRYQQESIRLPFTAGQDPVSAVIWKDEVKVYEVSPRHSEWFSGLLGIRCRLVSFPEEETRHVDPDYAKQGEQVSLADGYPLLVIGQASLDDLNSRMGSPVPMNRFRPNLVFTGGRAFEEDSWKYFRIGPCRFVAVKPCARCVLTTVDQETGTKGEEPLVSLARYRKRENKIYFGQNLLPVKYGEIATGQEIILEHDIFY